jgi:hypothetical protein
MSFPTQNDLVKALNGCKPSHVIKNEVSKTLRGSAVWLIDTTKVLFACFRQFVRKGSLLEWCKFLPGETSAHDVFQVIQELRDSTDNANVTITPPNQSQNTPKPPQQPQNTSKPTHQPQNNPKTPHETYFQRISNNTRSQRLSRIALRTADTNSTQKLDLLKSTERSTSADPIAQAQSIYQEIHRHSNQAGSWYRLQLILFGHSIDQCAASSDLPLIKGEKGKSYAFETIAKAQKTTKEAITKMYLHSSVYLEFAEQGGPGSLLSIAGVKSE